MPAVDILMATYNGERFIVEQIESILAQTFTDWRLIIRDDGSSDNTPAIIEDYAAKYPGKIQVIHDDAVCRSATKNFFELLKHAEADYVMFADQDDVWLKWKAEITYDYMRNAERENPGKPVMVFTGMQAVDAELRSLDVILRLDYPESRYTFKELITCNCSSGCTQMLNRACYEGMGGFQEGITLHDWWTGLYASAFGAVVRVPMSLMLYRQHEGNAIGEKWTQDEKMPGGIRRLIRIIRSPIKKSRRRLDSANHFFGTLKRNLGAFRSRHYDRLDDVKKNEFDDFCRLFSKNIFSSLPAYYTTLRKTYAYSQADNISRFLWLFAPYL